MSETAHFGDAEFAEREHDANGHYVHGPKLQQASLWKLIGQAKGRLVEKQTQKPRRLKNFRQKIRGQRGLLASMADVARFGKVKVA